MTTQQPATADEPRVDEVISRLRSHLDEEEAERAAAFARRLFQRAAAEDLEGRETVDLYGSALALWRFARRREVGRPEVRVFNPVFEEHGWQSTHTVIEVVNDDMPFLVDSVSMALNRHGLAIHLILHPVMAVRRDDEGEIVGFREPGEEDGARLESIMQIEVDRRGDLAYLEDLRSDILEVLDDVRRAVDDWQPMRRRLADVIDRISASPPPLPSAEIEEIVAFLHWLDDDHFVFLGFRQYDLVARPSGDALLGVEGSSLGILRDPSESRPDHRAAAVLSGKVQELAREPDLLILTKANSRATVHRPVHLDYVGVKRFDDSGVVVGEYRFLGLYTSAVYSSHPTQIPILRRRVEQVVELSGLRPPSHSGKALFHILETLPRDELFQSTVDDLFAMATGVQRLEERQRVRLLVREDRYQRYFACLVFVPRERYDTQMRERIQEILLESMGGSDIEFSLQLGESVLARVYFLVRCPGEELPPVDVKALEAEIEEATHDWTQDLATALEAHFGEERGSELWRRYSKGLPAGYRDDFHPRIAVGDIELIERLEGPDDLGMTVYRRPEDPPCRLRLKLFRSERQILLHRALPLLENMGLQILGEHPYRVSCADAEAVFIHDFDTEHTGPIDLQITAIEAAFQEALQELWGQRVENDGFNRLVVAAGLRARQITLLRACCKYLLQGRIPFSQSYMEQTLAASPGIARQLVELFEIRFDPAREADTNRPQEAQAIGERIRTALDAVPNLDQDRILRAFLAVIESTLRTNYFQPGPESPEKPYLSLKLDPRALPYLPEPRPRFEIFVYSPRFEGVHLRGGLVARGGIRWSDRREDFRTEILGLMKAQMVKNAVIVPVGAKGGFVLKRLAEGADRAAEQREVRICYRCFIRGLLDLTDNIVDDEIAPPPSVVRYDGDDPYLVVAADKGTATFSDLANDVASEYDFWLGDGFASGGSTGYDHKAMAITARGAWESVKRLFHELGRDIESEEITVVGIGDMSGDVFGNGMLLSPRTRLVAAFNHRHIFVDPFPDVEASFAERRRLFDGSGGWDAYDRTTLSPGGGIFGRREKSISITPEMRESLAIEDSELTPAELIQRILKAPVDLLWNGGIGTFVKASTQTHSDADDRSNDGVRVDGRDLRCKVVGEGGNLGFTQAARVEYAISGGRINTDFIDNSGGVDCSDHEVNIKILLNGLVAAGELTVKHRNRYLEEMTDEVQRLVLRDNYQQALAVSFAELHASESIEGHGRMIRRLELSGRLDRELEGLPSDEEIADRKRDGKGLTRPELAVLLAYAKIDVMESLVASMVVDDPYLRHDLEAYFPKLLSRSMATSVRQHRLRPQIIATTVTNSLVNRTGPGFAYRLADSTGASLPEVVRAYVVARDVFRLRSFWRSVEELDGVVDPRVQIGLFQESVKLVERATRWFVRHCGDGLQVGDCVTEFGPGADQVGELLDTRLQGEQLSVVEAAVAELELSGVPADVALQAARLEALFPALDIVDAARGLDRGLPFVADVYFRAGAVLGLDWLRGALALVPTESHWHRLAHATAGDELHRIQRAVTIGVVSESTGEDATAGLTQWTQQHQAKVRRLRQLLNELKGSGTFDWAMIGVALREARRLTEAG